MPQPFCAQTTNQYHNVVLQLRLNQAKSDLISFGVFACTEVPYFLVFLVSVSLPNAFAQSGCLGDSIAVVLQVFPNQTKSDLIRFGPARCTELPLLLVSWCWSSRPSAFAQFNLDE